MYNERGDNIRVGDTYNVRWNIFCDKQGNEGWGIEEHIWREEAPVKLNTRMYNRPRYLCLLSDFNKTFYNIKRKTCLSQKIIDLGWARNVRSRTTLCTVLINYLCNINIIIPQSRWAFNGCRSSTEKHSNDHRKCTKCAYDLNKWVSNRERSAA